MSCRDTMISRMFLNSGLTKGYSTFALMFGTSLSTFNVRARAKSNFFSSVHSQLPTTECQWCAPVQPPDTTLSLKEEIERTEGISPNALRFITAIA